jgi:hypothetical protein
MACQSALDRLHGFFAKRNALLIHLAAQLHDRMDAFPRHTLGPFQHGLDIDQLRPIPVQFQNPPTDIEQPLSRRNLINLAHFLSKQPKDFDLHLVQTFNEVMHLTLYAHADPVNPFEQLEHPS